MIVPFCDDTKILESILRLALDAEGGQSNTCVVQSLSGAGDWTR
jgi:hypothetical protein